MIKALIFDLDGAGRRQQPLSPDRMDQLLRKFGVEINEEIFRKVISGTTNDYAFAHLLNRDLSAEEVQVLADGVEFRDTISGSDNFRNWKQLSALLSESRNAGLKNCLATPAPPKCGTYPWNPEYHTVFRCDC